MKYALVAVTAAFALSAPANAQVRCHHDPVCQAKRDGVSVKAAKSYERNITGCLASVGATRAQWSAHSVPAPAAAKVRACLDARG
ncbi:hypothetical protein [Bradyrhizobium diazoefficiens]|uniref:hypothetical protein n=1 Tax=Bradyrhizobium diazoefficiens TaxID=1355477 RepID=UPI000D73D888|nr:hypothetical protein [Bradyrhizobium diazoefficiens]AWO92424.1 hypothetical protein DI395_30640 [Bradyrhizobium diazoefficiens]